MSRSESGQVGQNQKVLEYSQPGQADKGIYMRKHCQEDVGSQRFSPYKNLLDQGPGSLEPKEKQLGENNHPEDRGRGGKANCSR